MSSGPSSLSLDLMSELGCRQRAPRKQLFRQCGMFWTQIFRKSKATTTKAIISAPVLWHRGHGEGGDREEKTAAVPTHLGCRQGPHLPTASEEGDKERKVTL